MLSGLVLPEGGAYRLEGSTKELLALMIPPSKEDFPQETDKRIDFDPDTDLD